MCLQDFLPFTFIETRITRPQSFTRVKRRECADEVTVSRDKPPLLLWEQARPPTPDLTAEALSPVGCLSGSAIPPDHKHSPWAGWTVMDGSPWATRSAQSASCGVNRLTSRPCVYVDVLPDNSCSSPEGFVWTSWNKMNMMKLEGIESLNLQVSGGHCLATSRDCTLLLYHLSGPSWWFRKLKLVGICQYSVINTRPRVRLCVCWLCSWWPWVPPAESHCGSSSLRDDISPLNLQSESWHSWECPPASAPTPFLHRAPSLARTCAYTYGRWGCYISVLW